MRTTIRTALAVALVGVLLVAAGPASASSTRSNWREMTVGHFHLYSTLGDGATRNVARELQAFELTVGKYLQTDDGLPDVPTLIYILSEQDFRKYAADRPGLGGFFHEERASNVLVIDGEMDFDYVKITVFHEYTHFIQGNTHTLRLPPWFVEGYATLFSSFRMSKDVITLGELPHGVGVSIDPHVWIPMERLLAVKQSDPEYRAEKLMPQFYGESWALVHLLMFDDRTLSAPTDRYLTDVDVGMPEPAAFTNAFPFDKAGLDEALKKLIRGQLIHIKKLTLKSPIEVEQAPITRMSVADADAAMARLLLTLRRPPEILDPLIQSAVAESQSAPGVLALAARIKARAHDTLDLEAVQHLAAATDIPVQERIDLADALLADGGTVEHAKIALPILDGVVHVADPPVEAVMLWAQAAALNDLTPARVVEVVEPASKRAPHNTELLRWLAFASEMQGQKAKARGYYTRIMRVSSYDKERAWAQQQADSARMQDDPPPAEAPAAPPKPPAKPGTKRPVKP